MKISTCYKALVALMFITFQAAAQTVFIPDPNFKSALVGNSQINRNGDSEIQTSEATAYTGIINVPNLGIQDLTGIEAFTAVTRLYVNNNLLASVNVSANTALLAFRCNNNMLTSLDVSQNTELTDLRCYVNQLTSLEVQALTQLQVLYAFQNQIAAIDLSNNTALWNIKIDFNLLEELDLSANTALTQLDAKQNKLKTLNMHNGNNTNITYFNVIRNVDLLCIEVDDPAYSEANWQNVESEAQFSTDCDALTEPIVYIPDAAFKAVLVGHKDINLNADSEIQVVEAERFGGSIFAVKKGISDLTGLEAFTRIRELHVYENNLSTIDVSHNTELLALRFNDNPVASIDLSHNPHLSSLLAHKTLLTSLNLSANPQLTKLWCFDSQLATLDISANSALVDVQLNHNKLTSLTLGNHPNLVTLRVYQNQLTSLDMSGATAIRELRVQQNKLTALDISLHSSLNEINAGDNMITSLDFTGKPELRYIDCYNNQIAQIDVSTIPELFSLVAYKNKLTALNVKNGTNTSIRRFDVTKNPNLLCIQVDDPAWSEANWTQVDPQANFSTDCGYAGPAVVNIPDANFRARLILLGVDTNGDEQIQYSEAEAVTGELNLDAAEIHNPTGIEAFINAKRMNWEHNDIPSLDVRFNTALEMLDCGYTNLESLQVGTGLDTLVCYSNRMTTLNLYNNHSLKYIDFSENNITRFDLNDYPFAPVLEFVGSSTNPLEVLNLTPGVSLWFVGISNAHVQTIDLSNSHNLTKIRMRDNLNLQFLNIRNGNNSNINEYSVLNHPLLSCVEVDNTTYAYAHFQHEPHTYFSEDCDGSDDVVYIPDPIFKNYLVTNGNINTNGDSEIQESEARQFEDVIAINGLGVSDVTGIEAFVNITGFDASENNMTSLNLNTNDQLEWFFARNNQIAALSIYDCDGLLWADFQGNRLESLLLPNSIEILNASQNLIRSVNIENAPAIYDVNLSNNQLTQLDLRSNGTVWALDVRGNQLTWLNIPIIPEEGMSIEATNNDLTCIQVSDPAYAEANWRDNVDPGVVFSTHCDGDPTIVYIPDPNLKAYLLTKADGRNGRYADNMPDGEVQYFEAAEVDGSLEFQYQNVSDLTGLHAFGLVEFVDCSHNSLTSVTDMAGGATGLDCSYNEITEITAEVGNLDYLVASNNKLTALPELPMIFQLNIDDNELTSIGDGWGADGNYRFIYWLMCANNHITSVNFAPNVVIENVSIHDNALTSLDFSDMDELGLLNCGQNQLTSLKVKNVSDDPDSGMRLHNLVAWNNPGLTCIEVDDAVLAESEWRDYVDPQSAFNEDCGGSARLSVAVSPNPTMGKVTIESSIPVDKVQIFDGISGGFVTQTEGNELNIGHLHKGVYLLRVISGDQIMTTRVVKE